MTSLKALKQLLNKNKSKKKMQRGKAKKPVEEWNAKIYSINWKEGIKENIEK